MLTKKLLKAMEAIGNAQTFLRDTWDERALKQADDLDLTLHAIAKIRDDSKGGSK